VLSLIEAPLREVHDRESGHRHRAVTSKTGHFKNRKDGSSTPPLATRVIDYIHRTGEFTFQCDGYFFSYLAQRGARREGARCRTQRAAQIQHLIQRLLTILHRIPTPETRPEIQREAQRIAQISETPAFLMIKCRRGTREADPHSGRAPPTLGGALCAATPSRRVT
jgi:hypothetical protein